MGNESYLFNRKKMDLSSNVNTAEFHRLSVLKDVYFFLKKQSEPFVYSKVNPW